MARFTKILVALLCIVCVLALCIAPYVDIPVTVLKSLQIALMMLLLLAGAGSLVSGWLFLLTFFRRGKTIGRAPIIPVLILPIQTNCVQQC
jgi:hypothetical protein